MSTDTPKSLLELARSQKTTAMICEARSECAKQNGWKEKEQCVHLHSDRIADRLWRGVGFPPIATRREIDALVRECVSSKYLRDDLAGEWMVDAICRITSYSAPVTSLPLGIGDEEPAVRSLEIASAVKKVFLQSASASNGMWWRVEVVHMEDGPWSYYAPTLQVASWGLSREAADAFTSDLRRVSRSMWAALSDTYDCKTESDSPFNEHAVNAEVESLRSLVRLWLNPPAPKDQMKRRLRNAVLLMTEASHASHSAVGLALWCAAIEAMAVQKRTDISETLAANVTTLLQPDADGRHDAIGRVKNLYGGRSDLIHGNSADEQPVLAASASRLASGVLRAVMQWMRLNDQTDPGAFGEQQFFDNIRRAYTSGKAIEGVSPRLAGCLPGEGTVVE